MAKFATSAMQRSTTRPTPAQRLRICDKAKKKSRRQRDTVYRMPPPNDDLFDHSTTLRAARRPGTNGEAGPPFWVFSDLPAVPDYAWVDPRALELALLSDAGLMARADELAKNYDEQKFADLVKAVTEVFETKYLPRVLREFDEAAPLLASFLVAWQSYAQHGLLDTGDTG